MSEHTDRSAQLDMATDADDYNSRWVLNAWNAPYTVSEIETAQLVVARIVPADTPVQLSSPLLFSSVTCTALFEGPTDHEGQEQYSLTAT